MAVYFLQEEETERIKIGKSVLPRKRKPQLETGTSQKLIFLCAIPGYTNTENFLHDMFEPFRVPGKNEWFFPEEPLLFFIESLIRNPPEHPLSPEQSGVVLMEMTPEEQDLMYLVEVGIEEGCKFKVPVTILSKCGILEEIVSTMESDDWGWDAKGKQESKKFLDRIHRYVTQNTHTLAYYDPTRGKEII
jgi:hypothetical protein